MAKKAAIQHGGLRPGSGRKPLDPSGTTLVCAAMPTALVERLDAYAATHDQTRAEAVREAVKTLLNAK